MIVIEWKFTETERKKGDWVQRGRRFKRVHGGVALQKVKRKCMRRKKKALDRRTHQAAKGLKAEHGRKEGRSGQKEKVCREKRETKIQNEDKYRSKRTHKL